MPKGLIPQDGLAPGIGAKVKGTGDFTVNRTHTPRHGPHSNTSATKCAHHGTAIVVESTGLRHNTPTEYYITAVSKAGYACPVGTT